MHSLGRALRPGMGTDLVVCGFSLYLYSCGWCIPLLFQKNGGSNEALM